LTEAANAQTPLHDLTITALDGLPLSDPANGTLVAGPIQLTSVASIGFDIPLFSDSVLSIIKSADKSHVQVGESVGYRVRVSNQGRMEVMGLTVTDSLPRFLDLVEGTSRRITSRGTSDLEPVQSGRRIIFDLGDLAAGEHVEFSYRTRVVPGAPAEAMQNKATATGVLATGEQTSAGPARAVIFVKQGIFSFQQVLIGRVFEDTDGDGAFSGDDLPLAGVRVVLDNGMSSTTDSEGLYNIPSVPEGARMLGLDSGSYPPGYCPVDTDRLQDRGAFRLLRTPLQGGSLLKQNFILGPGPDCSSPPEHEKTQESAPAWSDTAPEADAATLPAPSTVLSETESTLTRLAVQTEELSALALGELTVLEPVDGFVSMTGALDLEVRTHRQGQVRVRVNDVEVSNDRVGQTVLDDRNQLATFGFVGIPLRPGPNRVIVDAVSGDGNTGSQQELTVYGRGSVERLRLQTEAETLPADGRSHTTVQLELVDAWGHPAQDARVLLTTSAGVLSDGEGVLLGPAMDLSTKDGFASVDLASELATGPARLEARYGDLSTDVTVRFVPAQRPRFLVGMGELTVGASDSEPGVGDDPAAVKDGADGRMALFYQGAAPAGTLLTAAYDSDRRLLFELDPLEKRYPVMGDSSTYFEQAQFNSRAYFKLEKNRSYLLWGDFQPVQDKTTFAENNRKLTGLQLNLENAQGDQLTLAAAEPDHAFARQVISGAGISGLYQLDHSPLVPGSEQITVEVHDRRNPEVILSQEPLLRGLDYDIDTLAGTILFKRPIGTFSGSDFDLVEVVVLYEFEPGEFDGLTWNGRGRKQWNGGNTRLGFSLLGEEQDGGDDFHLVGADLLQGLPHSGTLALEMAASDGRPLNLGNASLGDDPAMNGIALRGEYHQSFAALRGPLRASFQSVDEGFLNPFGGSVTPGNRRVTVGWEPLLTRSITLTVEVQGEENETSSVDNSRVTGSLRMKAKVGDKLEVTAGYDHRDFEDSISDDERSSDLVSAGFDWRPGKRWQVALRREQNVSGDADPSFPDSTFLNLGFQQNDGLRYFLKVRDSGSAIETIADVSAAGITPPRSETEIQLGAETRLGTYSTMSARYQIESGINGSDSFAVLGLGTRLPVKETLSVDFRGEAGLSVDGPGQTFESLSTGLSWLPNERLRTTLRYELRDAAGFGQTLTASAVGKPGDDVTLLARLTASDARQSGQDSTKVSLMTGLAWRPLRRDDFGLLFAWNHRDHKQGGQVDRVRTLSDTLSADGVLELSRRARWFGKIALSFADDKPSGLPSVSTTTTLVQSRLEYRLGRRWDVAVEVREHYLWEDSLRRDHLGMECGFWATENLRVALGYAFTGADPLEGSETVTRSGLYLNLTSKLNGILDLLRRKP